MIKIESKKNKFTYNVYHVTKAFYPKEDIVQTVDEKQEPLVKIHCNEESLSVSLKADRTGTCLGHADRSPSDKTCNAENRAGNDKRRNL